MDPLEMDEFLVDVFYYDYILTKAIDVYKSGSSPNKAVAHLHIATILCKRIRAENLHLDRQLYLKEAYLKVLQMVKFYEDKFLTNKHGDDMTVFLKGFECLKTIINEYPEIKNDYEFKKLNTVCLVIYSKMSEDGGKENLEKGKIWPFIKMLHEEEMEKRREEFERLLSGFSVSKVFEYLKEIHFENPVMKRFAEYVTKSIDKDNK